MTDLLSDFRLNYYSDHLYYPFRFNLLYHAHSVRPLRLPKAADRLTAPISHSCRTKTTDNKALRGLDDRDPLVVGEKVGTSFTMHRVGITTLPQIHALTGKRAEVVLFGQGPALLPPFSFLAGPEFMLTAKDGESECTLSRYSPRYGKQSKQCPLDVGDVLKTLGEMGGTYVDALEMLRQADSVRALNCAVKFNAVPQRPPGCLPGVAG